jgi:hypothetical protein
METSMKPGQATQAASRTLFAPVVVLMAGLGYTFAGVALLFAPAWFFQNIGPFPPFNRHYAGDVGAFVLPLGIGLLLAARNPSKHRALLGATTGGSVLHALNHMYDAVIEQAPLSHWLVDTLPLLVLGVLLAIVFRNTAKT